MLRVPEARAQTNATVFIHWETASGEQLVSNLTYLYPTNLSVDPVTAAVTTGDRLEYTNDATGTVYFTNLATGSYIAVANGPWQVSPISFTLTNTNGLFNVIALSQAPTNSALGVAYTMAASDARYQPLSTNSYQPASMNLTNWSLLSTNAVAYLSQLQAATNALIASLQAGSAALTNWSQVPTNRWITNIVAGAGLAGSSNGFIVTITTNGATPAANITGSHTLPDGVLSANVALLNSAGNTFTGATSLAGIAVIQLSPPGLLMNGFIGILSGTYGINADGTGNFASGAFTWDDAGNVTMQSLTIDGGLSSDNGAFASDGSGNVTINSLNSDAGNFTSDGAGNVTAVSFNGSLVGSDVSGSHTIADGVLSTNVPLLNGAGQTWAASGAGLTNIIALCAGYIPTGAFASGVENFPLPGITNAASDAAARQPIGKVGIVTNVVLHVQGAVALGTGTNLTFYLERNGTVLGSPTVKITGGAATEYVGTDLTGSFTNTSITNLFSVVISNSAAATSEPLKVDWSFQIQ